VRKVVFLSSTAILSLAAFANPAMAQEPAAAASAQSEAGQNDTNQLESIVVTARRVEENQQKVPVAVTTLTASALRERNVSSVSDLQYNVPNLQIKPSTLYPSQVEFILRGQRQVLYTDENVVTYVNGVPQGTRGLILYDMENVQSLKGPQGTLFGKNSMGGAMVFTTTKPKYDFGAEGTFDYGNYNLMRFNGVVNVPLVDNVAALRIAGQVERRDGVYKNSYPGMHDLGDRDNDSLRATLLLQPSSRFENLLTVDYQRRNEIPYPAIIEAAPLNATGFAALVSNLTQQVVTQQSALGGGTAQVQGNLLVRTGSPFNVNMLTGINRVIPGIGPIAPGATPITPVNGFGSKVRTWGVSNSSTYELSDVITLKNIFGYREERASDHSDPAGISGATVDTSLFLNCVFDPTGACNGGVPSPFSGQFSNNNTNMFNNIKTLTEEFQVIGKTDSLNFIAGGFYSHNNLLYTVNSYFSVGPLSLYPLQTRHATATTKSDSYAVFAQGTYDFSNLGLEGVRLTAGARYTWDKRDYFSENFFSASNAAQQQFASSPGAICNELNGSADGVTGVNDGTNCSISGNRTYRALTWTASLEYQVTPQTLVYFANRRGFKAGSPNPTTRSPQFAFFNPERITDYELGFKHQGRLGSVPYRLNVAGFIGKYKDIQTQNILTFCSDSINCSSAQGTYTDLIVFNVGQATIKGVEVEASVKPFPDLTLDVGYSYQVGRYGKGSILPQPTDATKPIYDGNPIDYTGGTDLNGREFAGVPRTTLNVAATYHASFIPESFAKVSLSGNYSYRGNTKGLSVQGIYQTPAFGIFGGRLSFNELFETPMSLSFWAQNLTNKDHKLYCADNLYSIGYASCRWGEPRTYGATLGFKF